MNCTDLHNDNTFGGFLITSQSDRDLMKESLAVGKAQIILSIRCSIDLPVPREASLYNPMQGFIFI